MRQPTSEMDLVASVASGSVATYLIIEWRDSIAAAAAELGMQAAVSQIREHGGDIADGAPADPSVTVGTFGDPRPALIVGRQVLGMGEHAIDGRAEAWRVVLDIGRPGPDRFEDGLRLLRATAWGTLRLSAASEEYLSNEVRALDETPFVLADGSAVLIANPAVVTAGARAFESQPVEDIAKQHDGYLVDRNGDVVQLVFPAATGALEAVIELRDMDAPGLMWAVLDSGEAYASAGDLVRPDAVLDPKSSCQSTYGKRSRPQSGPQRS